MLANVLLVTLCLALFASQNAALKVKESAYRIPPGGCISAGTHIAVEDAADLNSYLPNRINDIIQGTADEPHWFSNFEGCLVGKPNQYPYWSYYLYPDTHDANRVIRYDDSNTVFYFTNDHYSTFYRVIP